MKEVLVVSPHPDDETFGCGGTILKLKEHNFNINWLIITSMSTENGWQENRVFDRQEEIQMVYEYFGFNKLFNLEIPTTKVDAVPFANLVNKISKVFDSLKPETIFIPFYNDVHTDHKCVVEACLSCTKWFRHPYIKNVLCYEVPSETDFNINSCVKRFTPNVYINIEKYIDRKIEVMELYRSEIGEFPFPRSKTAVKNLAELRGSQCGTKAAEAFELLRANLK